MISAPIQSQCGDWHCRVFVADILLNEVEVSGVDEIDAIASAFRYLRRLIDLHKQDGIRVWWMDEGDDACL